MVTEKLLQYAFPASHKLPFFAFEYCEQYPENGWSVYEPIAELKRQVMLGGKGTTDIMFMIYRSIVDPQESC